MKLAVMHPYFFPYIGYWQLIQSVDRFIVNTDVNYIEQGWVNRNRIQVHGEPAYITAPIDHASSNRSIFDTMLQPSTHWRGKLLRKIQAAYRKAPYFEAVFPVVERLIGYETDRLADYLAYQLQTLATLMGIETTLSVAGRSAEGGTLTGQARLLDICTREGATTYINLPGGRSLYQREAFAYAGIDLKFLAPPITTYQQFGPVHIPGLSIIDVLMFNSPSQVRALLAQYRLNE